MYESDNERHKHYKSHEDTSCQFDTPVGDDKWGLSRARLEERPAGVIGQRQVRATQIR